MANITSGRLCDVKENIFNDQMMMFDLLKNATLGITILYYFMVSFQQGLHHILSRCAHLHSR